MLFGGCHPLPFLFGGCPPLPLPQVVRRECALLLRGCPPLLCPLASRWVSPLPGWVSPLYALDVRGKHALLCGRSPPLPPLVDARVKCTLLFRGSLLLFLVPCLAACKECVVPVPFPRPRLPPVGAPCPHAVLGDVPTPLGPRSGWVACRLLWRQ